MFEKFVLRKSPDGPALTAGDLAEALLFYQNVHVVLDYGSLLGIARAIGMDRLFDLLNRPGVSAVYCEETLATRTHRSGLLDKHEFVAITVVGNQVEGTFRSRTERIAFMLRNCGVGAPQAGKFAEKFRKKVPIMKFSDDSFVPGGVIESAKTDLQDASFVREAVRTILRHELGDTSHVGNFAFDVIIVPDGFHVFTDLDFSTINNERHLLSPGLDDLTPAHLIGSVLEARGDLVLAAHYGGDFQTSEATSRVIRLRYDECLRRASIHRNEIDSFHDAIVPDMPTIKQVIDSGARSFDEFLKLRDQAWRFRGWLRGINPDQKLIAAYLQEIMREQWVSTLPVRVARFVLGKALDVAVPILGEVVSGIDALLLDKVAEGWRPNHFIDRKLVKFLDENHAY